MVVKIKNADSVNHTWVGQTITPGNYYSIQPLELIRWQNDSVLLSAIGAMIAVVNDGTSDITDVNTGINYLKNLSVPYAATTGGTPPPQTALVGGVSVSTGFIEPINVDASNNTQVVGTGVAGTPAGGVISVQGVVGGQAQPISAAALPLPAGASTSANQTNGTQKAQTVDGSGNIQPSGDATARGIFVKPTDGANTITVKPASTAALATDTSEVVALSPNSPLPTGSNSIGSIANITGTVSLPTGAATSANQTNGTQKAQTVDGSGNVQPAGDVAARGMFVKPTDGTNTVTVKPASTAALATDTSEVVALSPNSPLPTGANNIGSITNVTGTVSLPTGASTAANQTTIGSQTTKVNDGTNTMAVKAASTAALATDPSAVVALSPNSPLPAGANNIGSITNVTGTVTLPTGASTSANQTNGTQKSQSVDGSGNVQPAGDVAARGIFTKPTDGTSTITVKAASTSAVATDTSQVVALSPNTPLPTGTNSLGSIVNVTGTVSLPTGASTAANQTTIGSQTTKVNDGTNTMAVKAASTAAIATDPSAVVALSPNSPLPTGANNVGSITNVTGTVSLPTGASTAANQTTIGSQTTKVNDGTNTMAVKAASTAAIATDPSAVVALSPNSPVPTGTNVIGALSLHQSVNVDQIGGAALALGQAQAASSIPVVTQADSSPATQNITAQDTVTVTTAGANGQNFMTGVPTAGSAATFTVPSTESVEVQVTGTWTGTLQSEFSIDGGTTWYTRGLKQAGIPYIASSFTANFAGGSNTTGGTTYRIRSTAAWTGTATVKLVSSVNSSGITILNAQTIRDGVTQTIINTIKAASTAAQATDTALVIAPSPNSPLPAGTNTIGSVVGNVASGAADSGNPIKIGGKYNSTQPTLATGNRGDVQLSIFGDISTCENTTFRNITTATTTTVKSGAGVLYKIIFNNGINNATITIYDNTTATGTIIGTITQAQGGGNFNPSGSVDYGGMNFATGLTIVTSNANNLTIIYK